MRHVFNAGIGIISIFILAPIVVVVISSFTGSDIPEFPPSSWSLRWYGYALSQSIFTSSAINSVLLAVIATAIATPLALGAALALVRCDFRGRNLVQTVLLAPLFVPAVVVSLAILITMANFGIREVTLRLVAAHVLITLPYLVRTMMASLTRLDPMIEEAARTLGASPLRTFWHVTLPLVRSGVMAGMLFALIISFDNVSMSLFLTTARSNTLPLVIMNYVEYNFDPSIAAISTMLVVLSLGTAVLLERVVGLRSVLGK